MKLIGWKQHKELIKLDETEYENTYEWQNVSIFVIFGLPLLTIRQNTKVPHIKAIQVRQAKSRRIRILKSTSPSS